jgi:hypothetical protein
VRSSGRSLGRKSTWRKLACLPLSPLPSLSLSLALTAPPPTPYPIACACCGGGSDEDGPTALRHAEARIVRGCRPLRLRLGLRIPAVGTADQFELENALWRANTAEAAWPAGRRGPVGRRRVTGYDAERSGFSARAAVWQSGRRTLVALPSSRHSRSALPCSSDCEGDAESFSLQHSRPPPPNAPTERANAPVSAAVVCCDCGTERPMRSRTKRSAVLFAIGPCAPLAEPRGPRVAGACLWGGDGCASGEGAAARAPMCFASCAVRCTRDINGCKPSRVRRQAPPPLSASKDEAAVCRRRRACAQ